jgi:xanthine dehydrogenase accessory factor
MRDVLDKLDQWRQIEQEIAVTTVIETWGSAPRPVGSKMITTSKGGIAGSVSAGCVEGAVIQEALLVMETEKPKLIEFGVADDTAWEVGLACGGTIKVFIEPGFALNSIYQTLADKIKQGESFVTITVLEGQENIINKKMLIQSDGNFIGDLSLPEGTSRIIEESHLFLESGESGILTLPDGTVIFLEVYPPPSKLLIIGAVQLADPLITLANAVGFDSILIDPREAFATRDRFPHVKMLVRKWPQEALAELVLDKSTYIVVLTHDPKIDDPALQSSLRSDARYVGALGSHRTNQKRLERLRMEGLMEEELSNLHAPIGLDLGGRSPGEIAVSIMAEIVKVKNNKKS